MDNNMRYYVDFILMPTLVHNGQGKVVEFFLKGAGAAFASIYNKAYNEKGCGKPFGWLDFLCRHIQDGENGMLYVTLPDTPNDAFMICTHMAIAYRVKDGAISAARLFHIEKSAFGSTAIGEIVIDGVGAHSHVNYGTASDTDDENIESIQKLSFFRRLPISKLSARA
ncbi:MAG: hypothetical protein ACI4PV_00235 [Butyricicoccus sp.]